MSRHILAIKLDPIEQARLDSGELVFPEHVDSHDHDIVCPEGNGCSGWVGCSEPHLVDGKSADDGPYDCDESAPYWGKDEFEFHGVLHTWRSGYGWTMPFTGKCIVNWVGRYDLPTGYEDLPIGEHEVEDDWGDESCYLQLVARPKAEDIGSFDVTPAWERPDPTVQNQDGQERADHGCQCEHCQFAAAGHY